MRKVKGNIILAFVIIAAIVAATVYFAGNRQNQDASMDGNEELSSLFYSEEENTNEKPDGNEEQNGNAEQIGNEDGNPKIDTDNTLSEQESDELINEMLDSLSELEETVNSLDDVSDSDLQIPE